MSIFIIDSKDNLIEFKNLIESKKYNKLSKVIETMKNGVYNGVEIKVILTKADRIHINFNVDFEIDINLTVEIKKQALNFNIKKKIIINESCKFVISTDCIVNISNEMKIIGEVENKDGEITGGTINIIKKGRINIENNGKLTNKDIIFLYQKGKIINNGILTNEGEIDIQERGKIIIKNDGKLINKETMEIYEDGYVNIANSGMLTNNGDLKIKGNGTINIKGNGKLINKETLYMIEEGILNIDDNGELTNENKLVIYEDGKIYIENNGKLIDNKIFINGKPAIITV